jgi:hypothetical protein
MVRVRCSFVVICHWYGVRIPFMAITFWCFWSSFEPVQLSSILYILIGSSRTPISSRGRHGLTKKPSMIDLRDAANLPALIMLGVRNDSSWCLIMNRCHQPFDGSVCLNGFSLTPAILDAITRTHSDATDWPALAMKVMHA